MTTIGKLKELALAADQGQWHTRRDLNRVPTIYTDGTITLASCFHMPCGDGQANALYIAAAHPAAVLELIAEVERLRKKVKTLQLLLAWEAAELSEGQVSRLLNTDRLGARELRAAAIDNAMGSEG